MNLAWKRWAAAAMAGGFLAALAPVSVSAPPHGDFGQEKPRLKTERQALPEKKPGRLFRRPAENTPAQQLAHAVELREDGKKRRAERAFRALVHEWHDASEATAAQMHYAELLQERGRYQRAFEEYQYLIDHFMGYFPFRTVVERQYETARQTMQARRGAVLFFPGFSAPERALPLFQRIVENAPRSPQAPQAQFHIGFIHEKQGDYRKAARAYERLRIRYPRSERAGEAVFRHAQCLYRESLKNPRDEEGLWIAHNALSHLTETYGHIETRPVREARERLHEIEAILAQKNYEQAAFYEEIARRPQAALIAYADFIEKFPNSALAEKAQARVESLQKEEEKP